MTIKFAIAPDIAPQNIASWHLMANYLQKHLATTVHATDFMGITEQRHALEQGQINLIYAAAFDARHLLMDKGFLPIARPLHDADEITIITYLGHTAERVEALKSGINIGATNNPDLRQLGLILLEPAHLNRTNTQFHDAQNHILAVKALLNKSVDIAIIPTVAYENLSPPIKKQLHVLVANRKEDIDVLSHVFLLDPAYATFLDPLKNILTSMSGNPAGVSILQDLNVSDWQIIEDASELDFMIDLVDTLQI